MTLRVNNPILLGKETKNPLKKWKKLKSPPKVGVSLLQKQDEDH